MNRIDLQVIRFADRQILFNEKDIQARFQVDKYSQLDSETKKC